MTSGNEQLPAEMRVPPTIDPTVEVDPGAHLPPEAAIVLLVHEEGPVAAPPGDRDPPTASYDALAAAEAAAEQAHLPPAEMRVPPTIDPTVEVEDGAPLPP